MAAAKKKIAKKAKATPARTSLADRMRFVTSETELIASEYETELALLPKDEPLPQELIAVAAYQGEAATALNTIKELSRQAAQDWQNEGGFDKVAFEDHPLAVVGINVANGARRPDWKGIAAQNAGRLAEAAGDPFDTTSYVNDIIENTRPGADSVRVTFAFAE